MNDVMVTVMGNAGNTPSLHVGKGAEWTMFRVASTRRVWKPENGWSDGPTMWFTVKAWRTAARNIVESVRKGDPVVVSGRLELAEWSGPEGEQRMGMTVVASTVGVDATRGRVSFARVVHHGAGPDGAPGAGPDGSDLLGAVSAGDVEQFEIDALLPTGSDVELSGDSGDSGGDQDDSDGVGQRELVTA